MPALSPSKRCLPLFGHGAPCPYDFAPISIPSPFVWDKLPAFLWADTQVRPYVSSISSASAQRLRPHGGLGVCDPQLHLHNSRLTASTHRMFVLDGVADSVG